MLTALDTEATGLDIWHGCRPFFVSCFDDENGPSYWEWDVNPMTRKVIIPKRDLRDINRYIAKRSQEKSDRIIFHNTKFDVRALESIGVKWKHWKHVEDTVIASHCMASGESHKLKDLAAYYLDIHDDDEQELKECVNDARRIGRKLGWRIAAPHDPHSPAMKRAPKEGWWVMDMWLPRAVAKHEGYKKSHPWWSVLRTYSLRDAERTYGLWLMYKEALEDEDLWSHYVKRRRCLKIFYRMETRGVSGSIVRLKECTHRHSRRCAAAEESCFATAKYKISNLESNKQLQGVLFGQFKCKPVKETKTGYSTAKADLLEIKKSLPRFHPAYPFLNSLMIFRQNGKALDAIETYTALAIAIKEAAHERYKDYFIFHPGFNPTGTDTTRSSSSPNAQNVSKQKKTNLRYIFGPIPGRVWYSLDYSNIELRIFAYCSGDKQLIDAFERGESVHLVFAKLLYPKEFAACERRGESFKEKYEATLYQWVKNGNFSLIYGAGERKADQTYHLDGAYSKIRRKMPLIDKFMDLKLREAKEEGFVTCLGGYRLQVPTDEPHKAVNYFVQGTAGWAIMLAMLRVDPYLLSIGQDYWMNMLIHDELDFDFPVSSQNTGYVADICGYMEQSGDDLSVPMPVEASIIEENWSEKKKIDFAQAA